MRRLCSAVVGMGLALCSAAGFCAQQAESASAGLSSLSWKTDAAEPQRFVAVHGQEAAIFGYPETGLEVWAYPLQILSGYRVSFLEPGTVDAVDGQKFLRRIEYEPTKIVRIYVGPDFVVRESLFVPLREPGALLTCGSAAASCVCTWSGMRRA